MILVDANILLYAYNASSEKHAAARRWLEETLSGSEPVGLAWVTVLAFLRIATNPRAFPRRLSPKEAADTVSAWFDQPTVTVLNPGERHWEIFANLLKASQACGPLVMDAHLGALALECGATLVTTDKDFRRFEKLRVQFPVLNSP